MPDPTYARSRSTSARPGHQYLRATRDQTDLACLAQHHREVEESADPMARCKSAVRDTVRRSIRDDPWLILNERLTHKNSYSPAGKPTQNAYIESFNSKFRDECLNDHYFNNLAHARSLIAAWRHDYNEARPHSAIGRIPPAEFAARHRTRSSNGTELTIV